MSRIMIYVRFNIILDVHVNQIAHVYIKH